MHQHLFNHSYRIACSFFGTCTNSSVFYSTPIDLPWCHTSKYSEHKVTRWKMLDLQSLHANLLQMCLTKHIYRGSVGLSTTRAGQELEFPFLWPKLTKQKNSDRQRQHHFCFYRDQNYKSKSGIFWSSFAKLPRAVFGVCLLDIFFFNFSWASRPPKAFTVTVFTMLSV